MELTPALGSERPETTLGTYYMDGYKQVLNSESIYDHGGRLFFGSCTLCRSEQRDDAT